jgi:RNA polymerase sigma-70 factor, ECF subfamily
VSYESDGSTAREWAVRMVENVRAALSQDESQSACSDRAQEDSWVSASQRGDALSFNRLVLKWERTVYNIALRMLQEREEATEATQEIFLLAFKSIRRFRRKARFSTWLYRIALNHCISHVKRRPQGVHLSLDVEENAASPAEQLRVAETQVDELIRSEQRQRMLAALLHLSPEQRAVVELKFFQGMTFEEIAAILEVPLSTIKSRLYTGLELLKIRLADKS